MHIQREKDVCMYLYMCVYVAAMLAGPALPVRAQRLSPSGRRLCDPLAILRPWARAGLGKLAGAQSSVPREDPKSRCTLRFCNLIRLQGLGIYLLDPPRALGT